MKEFHVQIPEDSFQVLRFIQEDRHGTVIANAGLIGFEPREVFGWHCAITLHLGDTDETGLPTPLESHVLERFEDELQELVKGPEGERPNALFLGRVTWNGTRELVWRVFNPEVVDKALKELIALEDHPREFEYEIAQDKEWARAEWFLSNCRTG